MAGEMGSTSQSSGQDSINEEIFGLCTGFSGAVSIIDNTWVRNDAQN